ncbi:hypothetical protein FQR65_LT01035 [Abscondita terminalis]|nr:hypothetical protein FQR65_LT01035 [Abscondita terminalis]
MSDEVLIESVRLYTFLYDPKDRFYHDSIRKENAWMEISKKNGIPVSECKKRWTLLRDAFRKALKGRQTKSGQSNVPIKKWKFEEIMSFMVPFFAERNQKSNIRIEEPQDTFNEIIIDTEYPDIPSNESTPLSPTTPTSMSSSRASSPPPRSVGSPSLPTTESRKRQKQAEPGLSQVLHEYLGERKQLRLEKKSDHLKKFFESMEETVRTFPPIYQIEVKTKIYELVTKYEYKNLLENENTREASTTSHNLQPSVATVSRTNKLNNLQTPTLQQNFSKTQTFHTLEPRRFQLSESINPQSTHFEQTVSQCSEPWQSVESMKKAHQSNFHQAHFESQDPNFLLNTCQNQEKGSDCYSE